MRPGAAGAMRALARLMDAIGYGRLYPLVTSGALFAASAAAADAALGALHGLTGEERGALRLFAVGGTLEPRALDPGSGAPGASLREVARALRACGLISGGGDTPLSTTGWVLVPALGGLLLTGRPPTYAPTGGAPGHPDGVGASAYLGPDSLAFASSLPDARGRRVLDLGTGCGVQGLLAARGAAEVVLSDVEERSLEIAALNALLNETAHPVRYALSDCFDSLGDDAFDLIVTLPPYVPSAPGTHLRSTVAAGTDGLAVLRRVLAGAAAHLVPGGTLVARCQLLCDGDGPLLLHELGASSRDLDVRLTLGESHPLQPYVVELATSLAAHGGADDLAGAYAAYQASLRGLGATGVCAATIEATSVRGSADGTRDSDLASSLASRGHSAHRRGGGSSSGGGGSGRGGSGGHRGGRDTSATVRVVAPARAELALRPAPGLVIETDPAARVARADGAPAVLLDGPSAALLAAVDGRRGARELAEAAWGAPPGASSADLADQVRVRLAQLARHGLVVPAVPPMDQAERSR
ncbi:MAG TPA: methyltransferase [Acidimicrobiales bacterium]|nr:methyltransferase [Acidimicrobiales bacterium]